MKTSSYEEQAIRLLKKGGYTFKREKTFVDLQHGQYRFDFFVKLKEQWVLLEIDGEQHFKPVFGRSNFLKGQEHDRRKNSYALSHEIPLYRVPYWKINTLTDPIDLFAPRFQVKTKWHNDILKPGR